MIWPTTLAMSHLDDTLRPSSLTHVLGTQTLCLLTEDAQFYVLMKVQNRHCTTSQKATRQQETNDATSGQGQPSTIFVAMRFFLGRIAVRTSFGTSGGHPIAKSRTGA